MLEKQMAWLYSTDQDCFQYLNIKPNVHKKLLGSFFAF